VPKKLFVYASQFSADFADSKGFGWDVGGAPTMSWDFMMANKTKEVQRLNGVYERMLSSAGVTMLRGSGSLVDAHTVKVYLLLAPALMSRFDRISFSLAPSCVEILVGGRWIISTAPAPPTPHSTCSSPPGAPQASEKPVIVLVTVGVCPFTHFSFLFFFFRLYYCIGSYLYTFAFLRRNSRGSHQLS
jgi:hypothetical protein